MKYSVEWSATPPIAHQEGVLAIDWRRGAGFGKVSNYPPLQSVNMTTPQINLCSSFFPLLVALFSPFLSSVFLLSDPFLKL